VLGYGSVRWIVCALVVAGAARSAGAAVCVSTELDGAKIVACGDVHVKNGAWSMRSARTKIAVPARATRDATIGEASITAELAGSFADRAFEAKGEARIARVELRTAVATATFRDVRVPFDVRIRMVGGKLTIVPTHPLAVTIGAAALEADGASVAIRPEITIRGAWPHWRAEIAWRGVELGAVVDTLTRGRVWGTGVIDGDLLLVADRTDVTLASGAVRARHRGRLRITDPDWQARLAGGSAGDLAIHERVAGALAELDYTELGFVLGGDPPVRMTLRGRGVRIPQDLELVVNLRSQR
jgi:hypothetical protein